MDSQLIELLTLCKKLGASDLHLRAGHPPIFRIGGNMQPSSAPPLTSDDLDRFFDSTATVTIRKTMTKKLDVDYSVSVPGVSRFRVNCFYQMRTLAFVFRQIPFELPSIDNLQIPKIVTQSVQRKSGLMLFCGPTGSGKSTTIAAILQYINCNYPVRIVTLEDPIEFLFRDNQSEFLQRELRRDFSSFPDALRSSLRQDPDIIMVGEMRETETIELALIAAETGHLVISTLHASGAVSSISRILGVFPSEAREFIRDQLASVLIGIVSQALIPLKKNPSLRIAAREVLINTPAISNLIRTEKHSQIMTAVATGSSQGMNSMNDSLEQLLEANKVSFEDALPASPDPEALINIVKKKGRL